MSSANGKAVTDSKADLVSMEMDSKSAPAGGNAGQGRAGSPGTAGHQGAQCVWNRRTRLERLLLFTLGALFFALVLVVALAANRIVRQDSMATAAASVCNTPTCIRSASLMLENMDPEADPCQDFYQYACGNFVKKTRIPDDQSSRTTFDIINDELEEQLRDILESPVNEGSSRVFRQARDIYKACMNLDQMEHQGLQPLLDMLKSFGGWPVLEADWDEANFKWNETIIRFRERGFGSDYLFSFSMAADLKNSTWRTLYFDQALLGISREYLVQGLEDKEVKHYFNYMLRVATLLGADREVAAEQLRQSLLFEMRLANISQPREERRNASKLYNPMRLDDMGDFAPLVNWTAHVNGLLTPDIIQVDGSERVVVVATEYLTNLTKVLQQEPKRNVANYLIWRVARTVMGYFTKEAREVIEEYAKNVTGKTETTPRWKTCVGAAAGSFSAAVGKMYVMKHFQEEAKDSMMEMVRDLKEEFRTILDDIDWMDPQTKSRAHTKLASIKDYIAYPNEIMVDANLEELYEGLEVSDNDYFQSSINMSLWSTNYLWKKLREEIDKTDWKRHAYPAVVNAFYSSSENSIQFPAGILQGVFFSKERPSYLNYGAIGWVIGHEITHGFDDLGRQYDSEGNLNEWWEVDTMEQFLERTQCIIDQYGNYSVPEVNMTLNGINTQGENIADNGGIKEAYRAYKRWVKRNGREPVLPGLGLNPEQLFWLAGANVWCAKDRTQHLEKRITTGVHSPGRYRVRGSYSNSPEFATDFNCPLGSPMNPAKKCKVW